MVRLFSAIELQKIQTSADFKEQLVKFGMEPFAPQSPSNSRR